MNKKLNYVATNMTMLFGSNEMITGAKLNQERKSDKEIRKYISNEK